LFIITLLLELRVTPHFVSVNNNLKIKNCVTKSTGTIAIGIKMVAPKVSARFKLRPEIIA